MLLSIIRTTLLLAAVVVITGCSQFIGDNRHNVPLGEAAVQRLAEIGSSPSEPMVVRVYKQSSELEVWKRTRTRD